MDKYDAGVITFKEIANCIDAIEVDITTDEFRFKVITNLSNYFKTLQNVGFDEKKFKSWCLE